MTDGLNGLLASPSRLIRAVCLFAGALLALNLLFALVRHAYPAADVPRFWPVSEVIPALSGFLKLPRLAMAAVSGVVLGFAILLVRRDRLTVPLSLALGLALALASNGILGRAEGYAGPVAGQNDESLQYYDDALAIGSVGKFLASYTARQPEFSTHTKTHPPGPVLLMAACARAGMSPEAIAIFLGLGSLMVVGGCLAVGLRRIGMEDRDTAWWTLLVLCLPAVQIYSIYSVDATIAAFSALLLLASLLDHGWARIVLASAALVALLSLSFGSLVFVPIVAAVWRWRGRGWGELVWIGALVAIVLGTVQLVYGYDYLASMMTASRLENPQGFRLLADPVSYLATRLENVAEPILFAGPVMTLVLAGWWRSSHRSSTEGRALLLLLALLGVAFLTGAYRTGETARACLFVVPFAALALARSACKSVLSSQARGVALLVVGLQAIAMQSLARFYW